MASSGKRKFDQTKEMSHCSNFGVLRLNEKKDTIEITHSVTSHRGACLSTRLWEPHRSNRFFRQHDIVCVKRPDLGVLETEQNVAHASIRPLKSSPVETPARPPNKPPFFLRLKPVIPQALKFPFKRK